MNYPQRRGTAGRRFTMVLGSAALVSAAAIALAGPASAATTRPGHSFGGARDAVFTQTDNTAGNQVVAYHRGHDGRLTLAGSYATGGLGGQLTGSVVDHLASQGSLSYDPQRGLLYAVNAGSDTVTVFAAGGDHLRRWQVISSGGTFPVSVAVRGDLVYVLNALNGGSIQGFRQEDGILSPLPGSNRPLGLNPSATPQFTNTPGQVAFSPDGSQLIVTTKANGDDIDVFGLGHDGTPSAAPVVNAEPGTVPFAIAFAPDGHLIIANAGTNALASYTLNGDGSVTLLHAAGTGQAATCWVTADRGLLFASNAGSASVSRYSTGPGGALSLLGQTATDPGTVDAATNPDGQFLYVQTGANGVVDEYQVGGGGTLTEIGSVTVTGGAGGEGITAP